MPKVNKVDKVLPVDLVLVAKTEMLENKAVEVKWDQQEKKDQMELLDRTDQKENQVIADVLVFMDLVDSRVPLATLESRYVIQSHF